MTAAIAPGVMGATAVDLGTAGKKERSKMLRSSPLIRDTPRQISPVETRQKHEGGKRVHGRKRIPSHILGLKPIPKKTAIMD
jgi:hypothetical protein